jgi:hypothetical protein
VTTLVSHVDQILRKNGKRASIQLNPANIGGVLVSLSSTSYAPRPVQFISRVIGSRISHNVALTANFLGFLIASSGAFLPRNDMLLIGIDGEWTRDVTIQFFRFSDAIPGLPMAVFQGMGSLYFFNPSLAPSLVPLPFLGDGAGKWLGFLICAALVFISTYVLGCALGMPRSASSLAAWVLPPLCLPYQSWLNLYLSSALNPIAQDAVSVAMLLLALLALGYRSVRPGWFALGLLALVVWLFVAIPLWIVLVIPTGLAVGIGIMASHARDSDFIRRTALFALPSLAFLAMGGGVYLFGFYSDTATVFFPQEMNKSSIHVLRLCSVATAWSKGIDPIGGSWVGLALVGIGLAIWRERGTLRAVAFSVLAALIFLAVYIGAYLMTPAWVLPYPIYFEFFLWPFYTLFAAYAFVAAARYVLSALRRAYPLAFERLSRVQLAAWKHLALAIVGGATLCILLAKHPFTVASDLYRPPADTAITGVLEAQSAIAPNVAFRGYVANLTGFKGPDGAPTDWAGIMPELNDAILAFGNAHRLPYLWRYDLATIESYSQAVEPAIYSVITRLLDRPGDRQVRNITMVTQANIPVMESLGVRFLITDFSMPQPVRLTAEVVAPHISHYLYELPDPNYGGYSPAQVIVAQNATDVLKRLADPAFDFRNSVVLDEPLDFGLQPAQSVNATFVRGGWRVQARSASRSLLLLPLQFSSCLSLTEKQVGRGKVIALRRANLSSTALVFEGDIDVGLSIHVSPFWHAYCRLHDAHEMRDFGLTNVPTSVMKVSVQ